MNISCWACGHPSRKHDGTGCNAAGGTCYCDVTDAALAEAAPVPVALVDPQPVAVVVLPDPPAAVETPVARRRPRRAAAAEPFELPAAEVGATPVAGPEVVGDATPATSTLLATHLCWWCSVCRGGPPGPGDCCGQPLIAARADIHRRQP